VEVVGVSHLVAFASMTLARIAVACNGTAVARETMHTSRGRLTGRMSGSCESALAMPLHATTHKPTGAASARPHRPWLRPENCPAFARVA
jgi:hypothetical protein